MVHGLSAREASESSSNRISQMPSSPPSTSENSANPIYIDSDIERPRPILFPAPPPTTNTLSKSQRAQLRRTSEKLRRMLGEAPLLLDDMNGRSYQDDRGYRGDWSE